MCQDSCTIYVCIHSQMCYGSVSLGDCLWLLFLIFELFHWSATEFQQAMAAKILPFLPNYMNYKYCSSVSMAIFIMKTVISQVTGGRQPPVLHKEVLYSNKKPCLLLCARGFFYVPIFTKLIFQTQYNLQKPLFSIFT